MEWIGATALGFTNLLSQELLSQHFPYFPKFIFPKFIIYTSCKRSHSVQEKKFTVYNNHITCTCTIHARTGFCRILCVCVLLFFFSLSPSFFFFFGGGGVGGGWGWCFLLLSHLKLVKVTKTGTKSTGARSSGQSLLCPGLMLIATTKGA